MNLSSLVIEVSSWVKSERPEVAPIIVSATGRKTCPSYPESSEGTKFAVRLADGLFQFVGPDEACVDLVQIRSTRLNGPCVTSRCVYWSGNCQLGAKISQVALSQLGDVSSMKLINQCPIRKTCRWRAENGIDACHSCLQVDYEVNHG